MYFSKTIKKEMKELLQLLFEYKTLDKNQAYQLLKALAENELNDHQKAAFLTVFCMRSITVHELQGFVEAMKELCITVPLEEYDVMDLCGTGGDGKNTFNISTLTAFIVAGSGQNVAKHGNNGVSSLCGSSNVLQALGVQFTANTDELKQSLEETGICFLHAPLFHPAMKNVAQVRKNLGIKTFFNILGPVVNPASPPKQLTGVYNLELARLYNYFFQENSDKEQKKYAIIHSLDGYDEISLTGKFKLFTHHGEKILSPKDLNLHPVEPKMIEGASTIEGSADLFLKILKGEGSQAQTDVVLANAGIALHCAKEISIEEGIAMAKESLVSSKAYNILQKVIELNNK